MVKKVYIAWFFLVIFNITFSQIVSRKYSNEFLSIGVGARALSMSNSYVAISDDATSGYWNPAGLLNVKSNLQISAMHAEYFAGIAKYDFGALATKLDSNSAIGASIIRFGVDNIPNTTELIDAEGNLNYDRITSFSAADYAFLFSYARQIGGIKNLSLGANAKIIYRKVGDFANAWGFGFDASANYKLKEWKFAILARDITSTFNAWSFNLSDNMINVFKITENEIPDNSIELTLPKLVFAASPNIAISKKISANPELDADFTFDGMRNVLIKSNPVSIDPHLGLELNYNNIIFLRGGFGNIQQEENVKGRREWTVQLNFGVGIKFKNLSIDYAFTDIGDNSIAIYSNIVSLKLDIYKYEN